MEWTFTDDVILHALFELGSEPHAELLQHPNIHLHLMVLDR